MTTIVTRRVNDAGPYAYRVHGVDHPRAGPNGQYWEYLGTAGRLDPESPESGDPLTDEEIAQLREEGFGLARYRETNTAEFAHKNLANSMRDDLVAEFGEEVLADTDDRRETSVELAEDAPPDAVKRAVSAAESDRKETNQGAGQAPLSREERNEIDFSKKNANVPNARAAKAVILDEGISNWTDYYEPENVPMAEDYRDEIQKSKEGPGPSPGDRRLDNDDDDIGDIMDPDEDRSKAEKHAMSYVIEQGDERAKEGLVEEFGWESDEVERLAQQPASAAPAL